MTQEKFKGVVLSSAALNITGSFLLRIFKRR